MSSRYKRSHFTKIGYLLIGVPEDLSTGPIPSSFFISDDALDDITKGEFKNIIDVLFDSDKLSVSNNLQSLVSENSSPAVRSFVQNVLMCDVQALRAAPDDQTAMDLILPRHMENMADYAKYSDYVSQYVSEIRAKSAADQKQATVSKTE